MRTAGSFLAVFACFVLGCVAHVETPPRQIAPPPLASATTDSESVRHQQVSRDEAHQKKAEREKVGVCLGADLTATRIACSASCADEAGAVRCSAQHTQCLSVMGDMPAEERTATCAAMLEGCVSTEVPGDVMDECRARCLAAAAEGACS